MVNPDPDGESTMHDRAPIELEQRFACQVANARGYARVLNTAGFPQTTADQVGCALGELWHDSVPLGLSSHEVSEIVNSYVEYDDDGEAWPRDIGNVVPLCR
jgi:hypothetical protein